ncbi:hypothetical protein [Cerasicoccus arenae]|uniref:DUF3899 domain-containing protein n=1 Tax=Cerasicoccus arenae TaxID=424488 RepID=A0A8J3GD82_9BACT|nr:hypothetical protein [Cerasicoccus arenae]MBK1859800.1 hypothetical protein [Cerasicoccus arenae]GHB93739.1 hypothetical protein GCM10007047_06570 [Cerasicoccus arenae]
MIEGVFWLTFSILSIGSAALGCFLLFSPRDALAVRYQNYMLAKTMRPLKDEDFSHMPKVVWGLKGAGLVCLTLSALMLVGVSIIR